MGQVGMPIVESNESIDGQRIVQFSCRTEHAQIFYTTDGSKPTANSKEFIDPIRVSNDKTIRAIALRSDLEQSPVLILNEGVITMEEADAGIQEDKIMGIFTMPTSDEVLVKYKTKDAGEIAITLIDMNRTVHHIDFIQAKEAAVGRHLIDTSKVPAGFFLIKFKFDGGKTTYRQVEKS